MRHILHLILLAFLTLSASSALAEKPVFGDTFTLMLGGMQHTADATLRSTREGRPPVELDLDDLEMDTEATTLWVGFGWQFADSWGISGSFSSFDGEGSAIAMEDGNYGDIEWSVNAALDSELDMDLYIIDLHWDFINTGRSHLGVGVGLHVADMSSSISARAEPDVDGNPIESINLGVSSADVTAPLPNVLVRGGHRFGDSFYIGARFGYFALEVDDVDGELITASASAEWRPGGGNFGLGLGYQYAEIDVTRDRTSREVDFNLKGDGPILFVSVGF